MNNITEKNVREFIEAINRDALEECNKLKNEAENFRHDQYEKEKKRIKSECERDKQYEITKIKTQTNREISRLVNESKKEVVDKREKITRQIFDSAQSKLSAFTESSEYGDFLVKSAFKITEALGKEGVTLFLREKDLAFAEKIKNDTQIDFDFQADSTIKTGGLKGKFGSTVADDTLDERLREQAEWFKANSGLTVI